MFRGWGDDFIFVFCFYFVKNDIINEYKYVLSLFDINKDVYCYCILIMILCYIYNKVYFFLVFLYKFLLKECILMLVELC